MFRGVLSGTTGMRAQLLRQDVIANNLANAATPGYRQDVVAFSTYLDSYVYRADASGLSYLGGIAPAMVLYETRTLHVPGPLESTGNPLDIALSPGAYLTVETEAGPRYTRRGDLSLTADGYLEVGGYRVLGRSGQVRVPYQDREISIGSDGTVYCGGEEVDRLLIVGFEDQLRLRKEGSCLFVPEGTAPREIEATVFTGCLEKSAVDAVREMVHLVDAFRAYEAAQRAIQAQDEATAAAVNRVGKV